MPSSHVHYCLPFLVSQFLYFFFSSDYSFQPSLNKSLSWTCLELSLPKTGMCHHLHYRSPFWFLPLLLCSFSLVPKLAQYVELTRIYGPVMTPACQFLLPIMFVYNPFRLTSRNHSYPQWFDFSLTSLSSCVWPLTFWLLHLYSQTDKFVWRNT